jgi:hypothetical protein
LEIIHPIVLEGSESKSEDGTQLGGFSGEGWTPEKDVQAFASILFEIVDGRAANGETSVPTSSPNFVSETMKTGLWSERQSSFNNILKILKHNNFHIEDGVDSTEVFSFLFSFCFINSSQNICK